MPLKVPLGAIRTPTRPAPQTLTSASTTSKKRRARLSVGSLVAVVLEELVDQMAIGGHELGAVEASPFRVDSSGTVLLDDPSDLGRFQRPVRRRLRKAVWSDNENARICPIGRID